MSYGRWPEDRGKGWDVTDEINAHGIGSIKTILDSTEAYHAEEQALGDGVGDEGNTRESQAVQIYKLVVRIAHCFHDETNTAYAQITIDDHDEVLPVEGARFKGIVRRKFFEEEGKIASTDALNAAIGLVSADACWDGKKYRLYNRVGWKDGKLYYDLTDSKWRAIEVDCEGWRLLDRPPILLVRHNHQAPQVEPKAGGNIKRLFEFISIASDDDRLLLLVWLVASFISDFPHPIPILHGPQGSGKSTTFRRLRMLIDPSTVLTLTFPREIGELVQQLSHNWAALYDNVADLPPWLSDALCRAVTGEGFTKRQLYTNDEDFIYQFQRVIGLNGINIVATRPDLLDRAILIELKRIAPGKRRTEVELDAAFAAAIPEILGGVFDALVKALGLRPTVGLNRLPRMADFAHWGYAIAEALGYEGQEFIRAYFANIGAQNNEVLAGDAVASAVRELMEDRKAEWRGTPTALLEALEGVAEKLKLDRKARSWPKAPHILTRRIVSVKSNLEDVGITFTREHSGNRTIVLGYVEEGESSVQGDQASIDVEKQEVSNGRYSDAITPVDATSENSVVAQNIENKRVEIENDANGHLDATLPTSVDEADVEEWI